MRGYMAGGGNVAIWGSQRPSISLLKTRPQPPCRSTPLAGSFQRPDGGPLQHSGVPAAGTHALSLMYTFVHFAFSMTKCVAHAPYWPTLLFNILQRRTHRV